MLEEEEGVDDENEMMKRSQMLAANYSLWPDNGRTPPDLFSAVMIFTPIKTMMMMMYGKELEG